MIRYIKDLCLTDKTEKNLIKIKTKLKLGAGMTGLYVIKLAGNENDVFDIVPAQMFKIRKYRHMDHTVIGFAESRNKAYEIVGQVVNEYFEHSGQYDGLRAYCVNRFGIKSVDDNAGDFTDED